MKKQKDKVKFSYKSVINENAPDVNLSFSCSDDDFSIANLHSMCKLFARALGFAEETVEKYFGGDWDD